MTQPGGLHVVMYHYVRDLPRSRFPRLKAMLAQDFRLQVKSLSAEFDICGLDVALEYLHGRYQPKRRLCLLTFDDGLKEHYHEVTAELARQRVSGLFFVITDSTENHRVAPVHKNHFLTASLDFSAYQAEFLERIGAAASVLENVDAKAARRTYIWDEEAAAVFKYFFNFVVEPAVRDRAIAAMFEAHIGPEAEFAQSLYASWDELRQMQAEGMVIGGHTHRHRPCSSLTDGELSDDLGLCRRSLDANLSPQRFWPFSYPYGKADSYTAHTVGELKRLGFDCSFSTEPGVNHPGDDLFSLRRMDCKVAVAGRKVA
ncbi:MAG: polysaccharide deacetylase family protein [Bryobacterales bacterium]|nr:polysaccharide deacetylase family protein [Bryobacterales bacterium]